MKAFLMYKDHNFDLQRKLPPNEQALTQDLELNTLFNAMALDDKFLFEVAKKAFLSSLNDLDTILYRQNILQDCLKNASIVRDIYTIAVESIESEKKHYFGFFRSPNSILYRSLEVLQMFVGMLKKLKQIADEHADQFESEGLTAFFAMLKQELGDEYFGSIQNHLKELQFRDGALISAELGKGAKGTNYILRKPPDQQSWLKRLFATKPPVYTFYSADRDENGFKALTELENRGINLAANALAQSNDHILSFFKTLQTELAFYVGCLNLQAQLAQIGELLSFPLPTAPGERRHSSKGLYDACLALTMKQKIVGNDANADDKDLVIITGANQGGKSTFLRSIGLAQLLMQAGMFVPATEFSANVATGIFTHFKREEDKTMTRGQLDEELNRMSRIIDQNRPGGILLCNESFASTNEREGSEIGHQVIGALNEVGVKVLLVTHLFDLSQRFRREAPDGVLFLRAERLADGSRTFKIREGEALPTSHGMDLYDEIFRDGVSAPTAGGDPRTASEPSGSW